MSKHMHSVASARGSHAVRRNPYKSLDVNIQFPTGSVKSSVQLCMDMNLPLLVYLATINDACAPPSPGFSALSQCRTWRGASLRSRIQKLKASGRPKEKVMNKLGMVYQRYIKGLGASWGKTLGGGRITSRRFESGRSDSPADF